MRRRALVAILSGIFALLAVAVPIIIHNGLHRVIKRVHDLQVITQRQAFTIEHSLRSTMTERATVLALHTVWQTTSQTQFATQTATETETRTVIFPTRSRSPRPSGSSPLVPSLSVSPLVRPGSGQSGPLTVVLIACSFVTGASTTTLFRRGR